MTRFGRKAFLWSFFPSSSRTCAVATASSRFGQATNLVAPDGLRATVRGAT
jgi:hypothetical protein